MESVSSHHLRRAQALVEWAIVLPMAMALTFGVCQWSLIQLQQTMVTHAAWNASRAQLVAEDPWDAAAITLIPVAGFSRNLSATDSAGNTGNYTAVEDPASLPGWGDIDRSRLLRSRLDVDVLEDDWAKVTTQVTFRSELLFPFVEGFFADMNAQHERILGDSVSGDGTQIGLASTNADSTFTDTVLISAGNFIELTARMTVPRIDAPRDTTNLDPNTILNDFNEFPGNSPFPARDPGSAFTTP